MWNLSSLTFIFFLFVQFGESYGYIRVCYYTNWAQYRSGYARYFPENYETGLCTHLIYAFGKVVLKNGNHVIEPYEWNDVMSWSPNGMYARFNGLKKNDPNLKTLLAIGGWNHASDGFKEMVQTFATRQAFITSSIGFLKQHKFDGLDLDWEYPAHRGSAPADREKFTMLCRELKQAFAPHGLLVTAAVAAGQNTAESAYEILEISKSLDFINLMAYDLHGGWEKTTGHHTDSNPHLRYSMEALSVVNSVKYWLSKGMDERKLILGLAPYGRSFQLADRCNNGINAPASAAGTGGQYTGEAGFLAYHEICKINWASKTCTTNSQVKAPFGSDGTNFIGYDDEESIAYKINNIVKPNNLGGIMVWALDLDDFSNHCGDGSYPIIKAAKQALNTNNFGFSQCMDKVNSMCGGGPGPGPIVTPSPIVTPKPPITKTPGSGAECSSMPLMSDRAECYLNPKGLYATVTSIHAWCQSICPANPSCNINMCCCTSKSTPITTHPLKPKTVPATTTTKMPTSSCTMPSIGQRTNCRSNPNSSWFQQIPSSLQSYCTTQCAVQNDCCPQLCCCDWKA